MGILPLSRLSGDVPVLGPIGIAVSTLTTVASLVLPADPVRHGLMFHNPSLTISKRIGPAGMTLAGGSGGILLYPQTDFIILQDDDVYLNVNTPWNAVTDDNSDTSLTIFNFTDNNQSVPAPNPVSAMDYQVQITSPTGTPVANLGTSSVPIIGANQNRRGILFQNPGTVAVAVCPANIPATFGAGGWTILPGQERRLIAKGRVRVNCGFNGIAEAGSNNALTILEFL